MRIALRWIASSFGAASLAGSLLACVSDDSAQPPSPDGGTIPLNDSGVFPGQDATVPSHDAGPDADAAPVDSGPQPVVVHVVANGAPEANVIVVFQQSNGDYSASFTTDATGTVSELVPTGSQVTALLGTAAGPHLVTVQAVAQGDTITFVDTTAARAAVSEEIQPVAPAIDWDASGGQVLAYAGSCYDPIQYPIYLDDNCVSGNHFPLLLRATDSNGTEIEYAYQKGNTLAPDGGIPDSGIVTLDVTSTWKTASATQTVTASALPAIPDGGSVNVVLDVTETANGVPLSLASASDFTTDAGAHASNFVIHPGYPDSTQSGATTTLIGAYAISQVAAVTRAAPSAVSVTTAIDLSALPFLTYSSIDSSDAGTSAQPVVTWTAAGAPGSATGIIATVQWNAALDGGANQNGTWTVLAPPTATSVSFPSLGTGANVAPYVPASTARYNSIPRVGLVQGTFFSSYDALRTQFGVLPLFGTTGGWALDLPPLPADGTLLVSVVYPNEG